jgi:hypothetical protein
MTLEWDIVLALVIAAFGFGYGLGARGWRRDIERLFP